MSELIRPYSSYRGYLFQGVVNNGNLYDSKKGIFTCPEDALYAFTITVEGSNGRTPFVHLYRSGRQLSLFGVFPDAASGDYVDTSSTLQIYSLTKGDTIYVYGGYVIELFHSTFAGWLVEHSKYFLYGFLDKI